MVHRHQVAVTRAALAVALSLRVAGTVLVDLLAVVLSRISLFGRRLSLLRRPLKAALLLVEKAGAVVDAVPEGEVVAVPGAALCVRVPERFARACFVHRLARRRGFRCRLWRWCRSLAPPVA